MIILLSTKIILIYFRCGKKQSMKKKNQIYLKKVQGLDS